VVPELASKYSRGQELLESLLQIEHESHTSQPLAKSHTEQHFTPEEEIRNLKLSFIEDFNNAK
jgi:hypothetical protein